MQNELLHGLTAAIRSPDAGCSGKCRGKGKRAGGRVIYIQTPEAGQIDLITVYGKDEADNLTRDETYALCKLARLLREEATFEARRWKGTRRK